MSLPLKFLLSHVFFWRCLTLVALCLLLWAGFRAEPFPQYTQNFDKWLHVLAFGGLTASCLLAFPRAHWLAVAALMSVLGVGIEFGQDYFLPRRAFDWGDFWVDELGVFLALVVILPLRRWV